MHSIYRCFLSLACGFAAAMVTCRALCPRRPIFFLPPGTECGHIWLVPELSPTWRLLQSWVRRGGSCGARCKMKKMQGVRSLNRADVVSSGVTPQRPRSGLERWGNGNFVSHLNESKGRGHRERERARLLCLEEERVLEYSFLYSAWPVVALRQFERGSYVVMLLLQSFDFNSMLAEQSLRCDYCAQEVAIGC
uniref:Secreted protein n=1 Tax=Physcomitrium patens TaxID=3218 RepID=A0A7I4FG49_PHYPA